MVARREALIREDGRIVDVDGTSDVSFSVPNGSYNIVIRHRNHLDVRTPTAQVLSGTTTLYDFTTNQSKAYQGAAVTTNPAMKDLGSGVLGMYAGNANGNTTIGFTGLNNDAGVILSTLSNNQATVLTNQYNSADLNMDGTVRFTGLNNNPGVLLSVLNNNQAAIFTRHQ